MDLNEAKYLLDKRVDPNTEDEYGMTPLMVAAGTGPYHGAAERAMQMIEMLVDYGAHVNEHTTEGAFALAEAVSSYNAKTVQLLIVLKADVNMQDGKDGSAALHTVATLMSCERGSCTPVYDSLFAVTRLLL